MVKDALEIDDTPVWRIYKQENGSIESVLFAWYTDHDETRFLTDQTFGTKKLAEEWLKGFWQVYWRL